MKRLTLLYLTGKNPTGFVTHLKGRLPREGHYFFYPDFPDIKRTEIRLIDMKGESRKQKKYSDIQDYYNNAYQTEAGETFPQDIKRYKKWFSNSSFLGLDHHGPMLDIGCGAGYICQYLQDLGYQTHGTDISSRALHMAKEIVPSGQFYLSSESGSLDFADNSFSLVTSFGVLEHLEKPEITLKECYRLLKPGASAIFMVPNLLSPYFWFSHGTGQIYEKPRTQNEWSLMFTEQGFKIIDTQRDPGPSWVLSKSLSQKTKYFAQNIINLLPVNFTYQLIFYLIKDENCTI